MPAGVGQVHRHARALQAGPENRYPARHVAPVVGGVLTSVGRYPGRAPGRGQPSIESVKPRYAASVGELKQTNRTSSTPVDAPRTVSTATRAAGPVG